MRVRPEGFARWEICVVSVFLAWAGLVLALSVWDAKAYTARGVGVVTALRGQAAVAHLPEVAVRERRPAQEPLRFRSDVFFRDVIDTQRETTAKLLLRGQATLTIRELSRVELQEGAVPTDPTRTRSIVSLLAGAFRAITAAALMRGDEMELRTPNAVAAIRGTDVWVEFYPPGTTLPPLPVASLEPRVQRASFQLAQAAPQDNTRIFVLVGQSCVAGVCAGPGEALEMVGNLPPRLFRFALDYIQQILGSLALGLQGQTGKDLDQLLAALQDQAAGEAGGGPAGGGFALPPGCTTLACVTTNPGVIAVTGLTQAPPMPVSASLQADFRTGSIDITALAGVLQGARGGPFSSSARIVTVPSLPFGGGTGDVKVSGLLKGWPLQGNLNFTIKSNVVLGEFGFFSANFSGPVTYNGKSLQGTITGGSTTNPSARVTGGTITPR